MNEQQANSDALSSDIRRLQEKLYSKEEDYTYKIPVEHQETWEKIEDFVEVKRRYDKIMSADTNEAMEELERGEYEADYRYFKLKDLYPEKYDIFYHALLKAVAIETELAELKKKIKDKIEEYRKKDGLCSGAIYNAFRKLCEVKE